MQIKIQHGSGLPFTLMNDHVMFDSNKNQYKEIKGKCTNIKGEITLKAAGKETFKAYQQSAHGLACQHSCENWTPEPAVPTGEQWRICAFADPPPPFTTTASYTPFREVVSCSWGPSPFLGITRRTDAWLAPLTLLAALSYFDCNGDAKKVKFYFDNNANAKGNWWDECNALDAKKVVADCKNNCEWKISNADLLTAGTNYKWTGKYRRAKHVPAACPNDCGGCWNSKEQPNKCLNKLNGAQATKKVCGDKKGKWCGGKDKGGKLAGGFVNTCTGKTLSPWQKAPYQPAKVVEAVAADQATQWKFEKRKTFKIRECHNDDCSSNKVYKSNGKCTDQHGDVVLDWIHLTGKLYEQFSPEYNEVCSETCPPPLTGESTNAC